MNLTNDNTQFKQFLDLLNYYRKLNSFLRHDLMSCLNIINLGLYMIKSGSQDNEETFEALFSSIDTAIKLTKRAHDLEKSITLQYEEVSALELIEPSIKEYLEQNIEIEIIDNKNVILPSFFDSVFSSYFRYATNYLKSNKIKIEVRKKSDYLIIDIYDNGETSNDDIKKYPDQNREFNQLVHDKLEIDLFITNLILKSKNASLLFEDNSSNGRKFSITFNS